MQTTPDQNAEIEAAVRRSLRALERPEPLRLSEWADRHFYLSGESSYIEGRWESFPYQRGIMDAISNDDIREVVLRKSARVGYTKVILAAIGYFASHKRRNQAVWQPVDDDADEFCKTEIDPMIRDVEQVRAMFPYDRMRDKNNTLRQKTFTGSTLYIRGGKAAKNYRRISVDVAYLDEVDGFDADIEHEGDPITLAAKRAEGATFPKIVVGSTPKLKGQSLVEYRADTCEVSMSYLIPCSHCSHMQPLRWGGQDVEYGMKWVDDDPETAAYLCESCGALMSQSDYLDVWDRGEWRSDEGLRLCNDGVFRLGDEYVTPPLSIAMHVWTAYSPMTSWAQIVREFLAAKKDRSKLKTFVNTTLGESWEEDESEQAVPEHLYNRREHYAAQVPDPVVVLTAFIDTQDDRFEIQVDGWGEGEERWAIDYERLYGDPSRPEIWQRLADSLRRQYARADGTLMKLSIVGQDFGGHYSDEVARFSVKMGVRWVIPTRGASTYGKPVAVFPRKRNQRGVYLTEIGTDTAKDLLYQRLMILEPGPGYWHFPVSDAFDETYFRQLTAERRVAKYTLGRKRFIWDSQGRRNEAWDCSVGGLAMVRILQQNFGLRLEVPAPATP